MTTQNVHHRFVGHESPNGVNSYRWAGTRPSSARPNGSRPSGTRPAGTHRPVRDA
jgi:hypothetical protein